MLARNSPRAALRKLQRLVGEVSLGFAGVDTGYLMTKDGAGFLPGVQIQAIAEGGVDRFVQQAEFEVTCVHERSTFAANGYEAAQALEEEALEIPGSTGIVAATVAVILRNQAAQLAPPPSDREHVTIDHSCTNATTGGGRLSIKCSGYLKNQVARQVAWQYFR